MTNDIESVSPPQSNTISFKIFQCCFLLAVLIAPLYLGAVHLWSFSISIFLLTGPFFIYWLSIQGRGKFVAIRTDLDIWIILYLIFFTASAFQSIIPYRAAIEVYKLGSILCVFMATLYYCRGRAEIQRLCMCIAFLGGALSLLGLLQYVGAVPHNWWNRAHFLSSVYVNHNHFAGLLEMILPVSLGLVIAEENKAKRLLLVFLCALMGIALILTLSRGGLVSITIALAAMMFFLIKRGVVRSSWGLFLILGIFIAGSLILFGLEPLIDRIESIQKLGSKSTVIHRLPMWQGAVDLISKNIWLGTGPGTFEYAFLKFRPAGFVYRPGNAHNDYLELLADCGIFAFAVTILLVGILVRRAVRIIHRDDSLFGIGIGSGCLAAVVSLSIHSLIDFNYHIPANWMLMSVVAGVLLSLEYKRLYTSTVIVTALRMGGILLTLAVIGGSMFFGLADYYLWKGRIAFKENKSEKAISYLDQSIRIHGTNAKSHFWKGLAAKKAEDIEKAIDLNGYEPYFNYHLARMVAAEAGETGLQDALGLFEDAFEKDPNDPQLYYLSGRYLLSLNRKKDPEIEKSAVEMLKKSMQLDISYARRAYEVLWNYETNVNALMALSDGVPGSAKSLASFFARNDLWAYHRPYFLKSLGSDVKEKDRLSRSIAWEENQPDVYGLEAFTSVSGKQIYKGKSFGRYGEIQRTVLFRDRFMRIVLYAKGTHVGGSHPYLKIMLDGKPVDSLYINSRRVKSFYTVLEAEPGEHTLGLQFVNDFAGGIPRKDRNIWIERIELQHPQ